MDEQYDQYLRVEWEMFAKDTQRAQASLDAAVQPVSRVLDIGCGAGQEMLPFVKAGAWGVGTDIAPEVGELGCELFGRAGLRERVAFLRSTAEHLPFVSCRFDVVISRLALPYTDNAQAIAEMARVMSPEGVLLLKIHHATYYLNKAWLGIRTGKLLSTVHAVRVLTAGLLYHLTGRQVRNRIVTKETFQTEWLLKRELARNALVIRRHMPDTNRMSPSYVIARQ